jgi:hypothetical protein
MWGDWTTYQSRQTCAITSVVAAQRNRCPVGIGTRDKGAGHQRRLSGSTRRQGGHAEGCTRGQRSHRRWHQWPLDRHTELRLGFITGSLLGQEIEVLMGNLYRRVGRTMPVICSRCATVAAAKIIGSSSNSGGQRGGEDSGAWPPTREIKRRGQNRVNWPFPARNSSTSNRLKSCNTTRRCVAQTNPF